MNKKPSYTINEAIDCCVDLLKAGGHPDYIALALIADGRSMEQSKTILAWATQRVMTLSSYKQNNNDTEKGSQ